MSDAPTGTFYTSDAPTGTIYRSAAQGCDGMTLRDYFAAAALTGLAASKQDDAPQIAYFLADKMLAARGKK
jgi:hypothetical protein